MRRWAALSLAPLLAAGCAAPDLDTRYAAYQGPSVNGVRIFADVLRSRGAEVRAVSALSPRVAEESDVVVVFQRGFGELPEEFRAAVRRLLDEADEPKTVLLVPRDFDAAVPYWEAVLERPEIQKNPAEAARAREALARASDALLANTGDGFSPQDDGWFGWDASVEPAVRRLDRLEDPFGTLEGRGVDPAKLDVRFRRRLILAEQAEPIWKCGDDVLLAQAESAWGTVYVLANASFLLNGCLVNRENRKLADALVALLGEPERVALALSATYREEDDPSGLLQFLATHPNPWVLGQFAFVVLLYCWRRLPIFGRPIETETSETRRFGRHVEALGDLLAAAGNLADADERLRRRQDAVRGARTPRESA
jgi:hypothetical protein